MFRGVSEDVPMEAQQTQGSAKSPWRRRVIIFLLLAGCALVIDGAYVGFRLASEMLGVADDLQSGGDQLREGNLAAASVAFREASEATEEGKGLLNHPAALLGRILPFVRNETSAVRHLMEASHQTAEAGVDAVQGARELGLRGDVDPAAVLIRSGQVQLPLLISARPHVDAAADRLLRARASIESAPTPRVNLLLNAFTEAQTEIVEASKTASNASSVVRLLPELLGGRGARSYFLAFQTLNEQRATGGLIGAYGILEAKGGQLGLTHVGPIGELTTELRGRIDPPPNFSKFDIDGGATQQFQQVNQMAHWPTAARGLLAMYEKVEGAALDGVIGMDPVALSYLMRGGAPIYAPTLETEITAENVIDVVARRGYEELTGKQQTALIVGLVANFWDAFENGLLPATELAEGIGDAIDTKHLKVFSRHQQAAEPLSLLEADDDFSSEGKNVQLVYGNNYSVNKIDYFVHRDLAMEVRPLGEDESVISTTITYENRASSSPVTDLNEANLPQDVPGTARSELCVLIPEGARWSGRFQIDGKGYAPYGDKELGRYPVGCALIEALAGEKVTMRVEYKVSGLDSLTLYPQAVLNPDTYTVITSEEKHAGTLEEPVNIPL